MLLTHSETLISKSHTASHAAARAASSAVSVLGRAGRAIWRYLEDVGQARAQRELRLLSARWAISDPEMANQIRAASQFDARSSAAPAASKQDHATPDGAVGAAP